MKTFKVYLDVIKQTAMRLFNKGNRVYLPICYVTTDGNRFCYDETFLYMMQEYWRRNELESQHSHIAQDALSCINDELENCLDECLPNGFLFVDGPFNLKKK